VAYKNSLKHPLLSREQLANQVNLENGFENGAHVCEV